MAMIGVDKPTFMKSGYKNRRCWKHCYDCKDNFRNITTTYVYPIISREDGKLYYKCGRCAEKSPQDKT
jgi:hypothetical protein